MFVKNHILPIRRPFLHLLTPSRLGEFEIDSASAKSFLSSQQSRKLACWLKAIIEFGDSPDLSQGVENTQEQTHRQAHHEGICGNSCRFARMEHDAAEFEECSRFCGPSNRPHRKRSVLA